MWYPQDKNELNNLLKEYSKDKISLKNIHGIIVPHAGYIYSGKIAAKAFFSIEKKYSKAIILSPSHYIPINGFATNNTDFLSTPLGKIKCSNKFKLRELNLEQEHAINNQIPFLQKININEIYPIIVGEISLSEAEEFSQKLKDFDGLIVISSDLSHFLKYNQAVEIDKNTIKLIENLDFKKEINACGIFPIMIAISLCKLNNWKIKLIEYKNSGDVTGEKSSVVGYASFWF